MAVDGGAGTGRSAARRWRRVVLGAALIAGGAALGGGGAASGEARPEVEEPPPGKVFAGPPDEDDSHADDVPLEVGDVVARGTRGADGECIDPPGGVGVGFTPPEGYRMSVAIGPDDETCTWVVSSIELHESDGVEERNVCPEVNTYGPYGSGCGPYRGPSDGPPSVPPEVEP